MPTSKIRDQLPTYDTPLGGESEGDLRGYVIFTQLKKDGPFFYAGWLDAADDAMALDFAREHYGQDQACVAIWAIPRDTIAGTERDFAPSAETGPDETYEVFVQPDDRTLMTSRGVVTAPSPAAAVEAAVAATKDADTCIRIWVVRLSDIAATEADDLIWRYTDQDYRLARGYVKDVRRKWEAIREQRAYEAYEKESIKETF